MKNAPLENMPAHQIQNDDYLDLWKYFEARADDLKNHMFVSVAHVLGFAAAVLGFIFGKFVDLSAAALAIKERRLALGFSGVGLLLCAFAGLMLAEYASHIKENWDRSMRCRERVAGLSELIVGNQTGKKRIPVWKPVGLVIVLFSAAFVATAVFLIVW